MRDLYAYELHFRNSLQNSCEDLDLEPASTSVIDTSILIGLEKITAGRTMFINCPRDFLLRDYISLFPPQSVVVEICLRGRLVHGIAAQRSRARGNVKCDW